MAEEVQDPNKKTKPLTYAGNTNLKEFHESHSLFFLALTSLAL